MAGETIAFSEVANLVRQTIQPQDAAGMPYIGLEHIEEGTLRLNGYGQAEDVTSTKFKFSKGDILFGKLRPYFRKVIRAPFDGVCSTDIWVVRAKDNVEQDYLYYWMASQDFVDFASAGSEGTKMPRAKWEHVCRHKRQRLSTDEQRAIAHILGSLDDKIELNRKMNETLEAMARAIFKSWFIDFEPVRAKAEGRDPGLPKEIADLFPSSFEDSELGPVPKGWRVQRLGEVCEKPQYGFTASAKEETVGPKFLRITDINKLPWIEWSTVPYCEISPNDQKKYKLQIGDFLIARMADPGHGVFIEEELEAVFASYLIRFRPSDARLGRYLQYWQRSSSYWDLINARKAGTTRFSLNAKELSKFPLIIPPQQLLDAFIGFVNPMRQKVVYNVRESQTLVTIRDALLPKLISSELRVKDAEKVLEGVA